MPDTNEQDSVIAFGPFRLFAKSRLLEKDGVPLHLGGRALDILIFLAERAGEVVDKRELIKRIWADVNVDEGSLRFHITTLRKALNDKALNDAGEGSRYVINVPGRGYCFAAPLLRAAPSESRTSPPDASLRSLPAPLAKMIGRDDAVEKISAELAQHRFVTIVGPGGIGKTSVALAVAHRELAGFDDQVCFVDFGALTDVRLVPGTIAAALGLTVNADDPVPSLLTVLRSRRMLLVFDSCEHILDELAPLAERMVREAPKLHILATSRESFRTEGERVHRLFPLDCPPQREGLGIADILAYPASQLFVERIAESLSEFELTEEDAPLVAEICRRLDGIALAIELAAGRVNAYGIAGTASLLDSRFSLLWRGRRTAIPRHQTLSAALAWSYDLLPPAESATLRGLSVFVGPFTLEAALAVASCQGISEGEGVEAISNLLSKSLIATSPAERRLRYRLLDTTRAFMADKLVENGEADRVARAHAEYFRDFLRDIALKSTGMQSAGGFLPYADHVPNVRAALTFSFSDGGDRTIGVDLAASAAQFFLELTLLTECYRWTQQALASLDTSAVDSRQEMTLQAALGVSVMFTRGNTEAVRSAFTRSLELARQLNDLHWQLWLLRGLHIYLTRVGDFHGALGTGEQGEDVARKLNDSAATLNVDWMLGVAHHLIGNQDKAVRFCESAMVHNPGSQRLNIGHLGYDDRIVALVALARGLWLTGRPERAVEVARYTVREAELLEQPLTLGISLIWTIYVFLWVGDWASAEILIERLIDHSARHFLGPYHAVGIGQKGELLLRRGDVAGGIEHLRRSQATLYATRHRIMTTVFATALAEGLASQNQPDEALQTINEAIAQIPDHGESFDMPEMLRIKGDILAGSGNAVEAESTLRRSLDLSRRQSAVGWELRGAISLARIWEQAGKAADVRALLNPLVARYQEGLQTRDLIAARELLGTLN
ncbi:MULTISPECIES: ATP-binding protein [Bradyrhizobium]|uniref:ATPase/DNA-binding winged helix-turn-helix (WHTH) protein n=1 Tax=Bradyrhizobium ottawaense TaxID=931866 RepID=A0A2U8PAB9_9BRAD|nr:MULTISPECIES: winged helix-turn-helix domain-containing protein [Bradyrhizobium]AWL94686.1 transcriptional regulator [Bradyrhizobium ottawaense]MBR1291567.1 winged helix-turn-helix domain-containing protein [Bradyrhizobium ottawaense]MBR1329343.1 winged helix-turn-helix domain-containing protein [Bradyrhizobium ottawaense]MBR1335582.1 winged helix-turn-helix domain-containing protein [Bradyrhizobium ottawaense]MDA9413714.1 transcriptional regulator [Bradyrhizobium sp. CCBAU 25360]